jgi:hypothetical protein
LEFTQGFTRHRLLAAGKLTSTIAEYMALGVAKYIAIGIAENFAIAIAGFTVVIAKYSGKGKLAIGITEYFPICNTDLPIGTSWQS